MWRSMTMAIKGTYSSNAYEATMAMDVAGAPDGKGMKMRSRSESRRIGECTADEMRAKTAGAGK